VSCDHSDNWSVWFSETVIITVKSVARKRLVKIEDFYVSCDHSDNWSVWFSETVIIKKKLNSVALVRKRTIPTERPPLSAK
jgi:hypothetical protein